MSGWPSFTGRRCVDELLNANGEGNPPEETDSFSDLCGLSNRYAQQGLVFETSGGDDVVVYYN